MNKSEYGSGSGQGTSAKYEITDGHCVSPLGNHTKRRRPAIEWRDELHDYWKGIIWQRLEKDR